MISELEGRLADVPPHGVLLHLAVLRADGSPVVRQARGHVTFDPDRLYFAAPWSERHAADLRADPRVAGWMAAERVAFTGTVRELHEQAHAPFPVTPGQRVYRLDVAEWTLLDGQEGSVIPARP